MTPAAHHRMFGHHHWFNYQAHHRGWLHALLTSLIDRALGLDPSIFQRSSAKNLVR